MSGHWFTADTALYGLDCRDVLPVLKDASVDSVVTDPPYELGFMGKSWDSKGIAYDEDMWREVLRVLKPGGHLVAFGGTRTYHRMTVAIEDAGFEIRDSLHWLYGSGFPKGLDVSKAIDKAAGVEREVIGDKLGQPGYSLAVNQAGGRQAYGEFTDAAKECEVTAPATDAARQWDGWNVALKPGHEPIVLVRKTFRGTVAQNVMEHGTGALNIAACRVGHGDDLSRYERSATSGFKQGGVFGDGEPVLTPAHDAGRWPPNVLLTHAIDCQATGTRQVQSSEGAVVRASAASGTGNTSAAYGAESRQAGNVRPGYGLETVTAYACAPGCPVAGLDGQSGVSKSTGGSRPGSTGVLGKTDYGHRSSPDREAGTTGFGGTGGASRFFPQLDWSPEYDLPFLYQAKAPKSERPVIEEDGRKIVHSTVKPLALMRWLARLVTPPGGVVLDPFAGTGTTLQAARLEGFRSIGCDDWDDAIALSRKRLGL